MDHTQNEFIKPQFDGKLTRLVRQTTTPTTHTALGPDGFAAGKKGWGKTLFSLS